VLCDRKERLELEAQPRHEEVGLVTGFAHKGHGVVAGQLLTDPLSYKSDLGGADAIDRREGSGKQEKQYQHEKKKQNHDGTF
jgi:hypothetical protein